MHASWLDHVMCISNWRCLVPKVWSLLRAIRRKQKSVFRKVQRSLMLRWQWWSCRNTRRLQTRVIYCEPRSLLQNQLFSRLAERRQLTSNSYLNNTRLQIGRSAHPVPPWELGHLRMETFWHAGCSHTTRNMSTSDLLSVTLEELVIDLWPFETNWSKAIRGAPNPKPLRLFCQKGHNFLTRNGHKANSAGPLPYF